MYPYRTPKRNVWLITWEQAPATYRGLTNRRKIAAILDSRRSSTFIQDYLPLLYSTERDLLISEKFNEMYTNSTKRYKNSNANSLRFDSGILSFGANPWLSARKVKGLFIDVFDSNSEIVYWTEYGKVLNSSDDLCPDVGPDRYVMLKACRGPSGWDELIQYDSLAKPPKRLPRA